MFCFYLWRLEVVGREKHHCKVNCLILTVLRNGETNLKRKFWSAVQILHRDKFLWKLKQTIMYKGHQLCWGGAQANVFVPGSWGRLPASGHLGYVGFMSFQHARGMQGGAPQGVGELGPGQQVHTSPLSPSLQGCCPALKSRHLSVPQSPRLRDWEESLITGIRINESQGCRAFLIPDE